MWPKEEKVFERLRGTVEVKPSDSASSLKGTRVLPHSFIRSSDADAKHGDGPWGRCGERDLVLNLGSMHNTVKSIRRSSAMLVLNPIVPTHKAVRLPRAHFVRDAP